jgi:hypothetical protein
MEKRWRETASSRLRLFSVVVGRGLFGCCRLCPVTVDAARSSVRARRSREIEVGLGELARRRAGRGSVASVPVAGDGGHDEGVAEQVEVLAGVADCARTAEVESVVEIAVDRLGIVATWVEPGEVGVRRRDGSEVLSAVEFASSVGVVAVEATGQRAGAVALGELVVVVPAEPAALVAVAVGAHASQVGEGELARVGWLADAERATAGVEPQCVRASVRAGDGPAF